MEQLQDKPKITVTRSGVLRVTPAEIFNSKVGRDQILKTAKIVTLRSQGLRSPNPAPAGKS